MKRTYRQPEPEGFAICIIGDRSLELPVAPGILKHPTVEQLAGLLADPAVARKYTRAALRRAPWSILRRFPRRWLIEQIEEADLPIGRRRALEHVLGVSRSG